MKVGLSNTNWQEVIFSEAIEVNPKRPMKKEEPAKFVGMTDLEPFRRKIPSYEKRKFKGGGAKFRNDDTLLARITPCLENGKTALVDFLEDGEIGFGSTEFIVLSAKKEKTDPFFVYYLVRNPTLRKIIIKSMTGTSGRQRVENAIFDNITISLPSLPEQAVIGKTLSDLDIKIEINRKMNQTLEAIGQAVFKHWFVDFEFPNEEGKPYKSSGGEMVDAGEMGKKIPKGWKIGRIEDVADVVGGGTPSTKVESYFTNTGIHWLTPRDLSGFLGKFIDKGATDITEEGLKNSSAKLMPKGTILFTSRAPIGYVAIALNSITTNQGFKSLIPKNKMQTEYLYQYLRMITPYIQSISCGSTFGEISGKAMKGIKITIPERLMVEKFEELMAPVNLRIINNMYGVRTLKEIRDSLLPRLMSGRIRIPVEERTADGRK